MKLKIFNFDTELNLDQKRINIVEIHNPVLFRKVIETIKSQSLNEETEETVWIYKNDFKQIKSSSIEIVFDYFNVFSSVRIVKPIAKKITQHLDESKRDSIHEINIHLNKLAVDLLYDLDLDIDHKEDFDISDLLSILKVKIPESNNLLDNLFTVVDYLSSFKPNHVLFIANLKLYLSVNEIIEFYSYVLVKQVVIILLEGRASDSVIENEQKLVIDEDYYDYYKEYS